MWPDQCHLAMLQFFDYIKDKDFSWNLIYVLNVTALVKNN